MYILIYNYNSGNVIKDVAWFSDDDVFFFGVKVLNGLALGCDWWWPSDLTLSFRGGGGGGPGLERGGGGEGKRKRARLRQQPVTRSLGRVWERECVCERVCVICMVCAYMGILLYRLVRKTTSLLVLEGQRRRREQQKERKKEGKRQTDR